MSEDLDLFYLYAAIAPLLSGRLLFRLYLKKKKDSRNDLSYVVTWNLVATGFLLLTLFFFSETYFRFFVDTTDSFGLSKITQRWGRRHYVLNNLRARDNQDYQRKLSGQRRISFIGDSFTAGHGVKNVEDRFVNIIRKSTPNLEVHAIAANGLETIHEIDLIGKLSSSDGYEFDVVVLVYNLNDIAPRIPQTAEVYEKIAQISTDLNYFISESYFLNALYFRSMFLQNPDLGAYYNYLQHSYQSPRWEEQKADLLKLKRTVDGQGAKLLVVTFPFLHNLSEGYEFQEAHDRLNKMWLSLEVPHLDLLEVMASGGQSLVVNDYDAHPNELAHLIAANAIADFLKNHIQK